MSGLLEGAADCRCGLGLFTQGHRVSESEGIVARAPCATRVSPQLDRQAQQPDIDELFYGSPYPRRQRIIDALRARGVGVVNLDAAFGEERNKDILRSSAVLNMHA